MIVTPAALRAIYQNLQVVFKSALDATQPLWPKVAMRVTSTTAEEIYGWLTAIPGMREWIGDRLIKSLAAEGYVIRNKPWESTIGVKRDDIEDDRLGVYAPLVQQLARAAATHPDALIWALLKAGFATVCHDGQYFFDTDHPLDATDASKGTWSNSGGGSGTGWYLLDVSQAIKPLIFQERKSVELVSLTNPDDANVFMRAEFLHGVSARHNVGYGLPQLAYASKQTLNAANYAAARAAMMSLTNEEGRPLNILGAGKPLLIVPPTLESVARPLIYNSTVVEAGAPVDNPWKDTAELMVVTWLA